MEGFIPHLNSRPGTMSNKATRGGDEKVVVQRAAHFKKAYLT
jgi:hypothetical protein